MIFLSFKSPRFESNPASLIPGGDLHYHLSQHGVFSEKEMRFYATEIILGLEHMHSRFVVYRDLKVRLCDRLPLSPGPAHQASWAWPGRRSLPSRGVLSSSPAPVAQNLYGDTHLANTVKTAIEIKGTLTDCRNDDANISMCK